MALTDSMCKNAKPKEKHYKISDSGGLYLLVATTGTKSWRLKYRFDGKEKLLVLGTYPLISLADAREARDKAKKLLSASIDPSEAKKDRKRQVIRNATNTFKSIASEWREIKKEEWTVGHYENILTRLEKDIFPFLGAVQIDKIEAPELLQVLKKIEKRGAFDLAARNRQLCGQIFRYAIQTGRCKTNPSIDLYGALKTRKTKHFAAITPSEIPELLKALELNDARLFGRTRRAIKLSLLTFVRPGELRKCQWSEIDFDKKIWLIPPEKMKSRREHLIPLSLQAIEILQEQKNETGHYNTDYVFPCRIKTSQCMSDGTVRIALQRLGFKDRMTAHGFRAVARTTIREELDYDPDIIEAQLAHKPPGPLGAAYDRAQFIKQRKTMMQEWADYLDKVASNNIN